MGISFVIAVGTVVLGMPVAQFLARGTGRGKVFIEMCLLLPLFGDIFTGLRVALRVRPQGIVNWFLMGIGLIHEPLHLVNQPISAVIAMMLPSLSVLLMRGALVRVDPVYEEAAQMLGANPLRAWYATTFKLARVGVAGAFLLTFIGATGAFTLPVILVNANNDWISTQLRALFTGNNVTLASSLSIVLTLLTAFLVYIYIRLTDVARGCPAICGVVDGPSGSGDAFSRSTRSRRPCSWHIRRCSCSSSRRVTTSSFRRGTSRWTLSTRPSSPLCSSGCRSASPWDWRRPSCSWPLPSRCATPRNGCTSGEGRWPRRRSSCPSSSRESGTWLRLGRPISWSFPTSSVRSAGVLLPTVVFNLVWMVRAIQSSLSVVDPAYEDAALMLGASRVRAFFSITLPAIVPGIAVGSMVTFANATTAFTAPFFLGRTTALTSTVGIFNELSRNSLIPRLAAEALVVELLVMTFVLAAYIMARKRFRGLIV